VGEVKAAWWRFGLALRAQRRAAVGDARHVMRPEGRRGRWKPEVGADGSRIWEPMYQAKRSNGAGRFRWEWRRDENGLSDEMGRKARMLQHKLFLFFWILNRILDSKIKGLKYFWTEVKLGEISSYQIIILGEKH
jgi:hypothetical protein